MRALPSAPLLLLAACSPSGEAGMTRLVDTAMEVAQRLPADPVAPAAHRGYQVLAQRDGLARGAVFEPGAASFALVSHRWTADRSAIEATWTDRFESGLALQALAAAGTDELCVAGLTPGGALRVERWTLAEARDGRSTVVRERTTCFEQPASPGLRLLVPDPDGRYLLALEAGGERLWQIGLGPHAEPAMHFDAAEFPALRDAGLALVGEHLTAGRACCFESTLTGERALFLDRDHDGVFDRFENFDPAGWSASEFAGAVWLDERLYAAR